MGLICANVMGLETFDLVVDVSPFLAGDRVSGDDVSNAETNEDYKFMQLVHFL